MELPKKIIRMQGLKILGFLSLSFIAHLVFAQSIVKWVDEKGVVHYGDVIPPQYAGRASQELNKRGTVIQQHQAVVVKSAEERQRDLEEQQRQLDQKRRDNALLNSYSSEQEIDLARERSIQIDKASIESLDQQIKEAQKRADTTQKAMNDRLRNKTKVPTYMTDDLNGAQATITNLQAQIKEKQKSMAQNQLKFDEEKRKYHLLKTGMPDSDTTSKVAPTSNVFPVVAPPQPSNKPLIPVPAPVAPAPKPVTPAPAAPAK